MASLIHRVRKGFTLRPALYAALFGTVGVASTANAAFLVTGNVSGWSTYDDNVNQTGSKVTVNPNSTASGTVDPTGTATDITGTATGNPPPDGSGQRIFTTGTEHMASSLSHASVTNTEYDTGVNHFYTGYDGGTMLATWKDQLHFTVTGATANTVTTIHVNLRQTGHMLPSGSNTENPASNAGVTQTDFIFAGQGLQFKVGLNDAGQGSTAGAGATVQAPVYTVTSVTPNLIAASGDFTITGPSASIPISLSMNSFIRDGMDTDYTAAISLGTPSGVLMTSDSGVFASAVPEPASLSLEALGGLTLLGRHRFRRRSLVAGE
jgi:hypothetical protein